jgi:hypothetical protein
LNGIEICGLQCGQRRQQHGAEGEGFDLCHLFIPYGEFISNWFMFMNGG